MALHVNRTYSTSPIFQTRDVVSSKNEIGSKYMIFMVGLPARGKSYISKKLCRYLCWSGFNAKVFNVGNARRMENHSEHDARFFDPGNANAQCIREKVAFDTLECAIQWLLQGGKVAIHDATNSTVHRRAELLERVSRYPNIQPLFIESICRKQDVLEKNVLMKLKGPDYIGMDPQQALADFRARIANYEKVYESISEKEEDLGVSFIKIVDVGRKVIAHMIKGYVASQCVSYLMQMHLQERSIWISRHGESVFNTQNRIGGNSGLTERGYVYTSCLSQFVQSESPNVMVWSSALDRCMEIGASFGAGRVLSNRSLNEIDAGQFEGMTYEEIKTKYPVEYHTRQRDKLRYRYPGNGESYMDVIERIRPVIVEIERSETDLLIHTHNAVARALLGYFLGWNCLLGISLEKLPSLDIPLHTCYRLMPKPYTIEMDAYKLNFETLKFEKTSIDLV